MVESAADRRYDTVRCQQFRGCEQLPEVNATSVPFGNLIEDWADSVDRPEVHVRAISLRRLFVLRFQRLKFGVETHSIEHRSTESHR